MAEADVLGGNSLVDTAGEDDALVRQLGQDIRDLDALGEVDGRHGVRLVLRLRCDNLQTQVVDGLLDLVGDLDVLLEALGERLGQDLGQGSVQGADKLGRRCGKVRGLLRFVVLHDCEEGV